MTRHENNTLDPREAAELEALEAALAGSAADPEWAALVTAVRDEPPVAGDRARESLDANVAAGFPRTSRRPGWLRIPSRGKLLPALAATSALVIGGVVVGTDGLGGSSSSDTSVSSSSEGASATRSEAAPGAAAPSDGSAAESSAADDQVAQNTTEALPPSARLSGPPGVGGRGSSSKKADAVPPGQRSVERTATLELTTGARKLQDASDRIIRATQDLRGVVASSSISGGPSGGSADFDLRIPSARLDAALKRFGEIANVSRLSQGSQDITNAVVSSKDRLSDARSERKALLKALGKAEKEQTISSLRSRITINRGQLAQLEADLRSLDQRSTMASVQVTLAARGEASANSDDEGGAWGPGAAADTALRVLEVAAGVVLVGAAILAPPLLLLALLLGVGGRALRRRRESALGAT